MYRIFDLHQNQSIVVFIVMPFLFYYNRKRFKNHIINEVEETIMQVVIMAGGKGTRIASIRSDVPKPMIPICGKPILEHQIEVLKRQGYTDIILVIGHLGNTIRQYFSSGENYGVSIRYIEEEQPLGTAGALYYLKEMIQEDFLLLNGDIIFDIDIARMFSYHKQKGGMATILTHPNSHPYDSGLVFSDQDGLVQKWLAKEDSRTYYRNRVNAGIHILSPSILSYFSQPKKVDLDRDILKKLISTHQLYAYASPEYIKDMGTPQRYTEVTEDIQKGKVKMKNLHQQQKAFFLDRDGTLNVFKNFITKAEDIELCKGAAEALRMINESGYLAIVVSNQPVIARGEASFEEVERMMDRLETLLGEQGAYIDDRFYCPHHPERGFEGEVPELKISCNCRKPQPGLLLQASEKYNIDLSSSYMVGDSLRDVEAGNHAGCTSFLLNDQKGNHYDYNDLLECVKAIL